MSFVKNILIGVSLISTNVFGDVSMSSFSHFSERKIASYFSEVSKKICAQPRNAQDLMRSHYRHLRWISADGSWANPTFESISETLLSTTLKPSNFQTLLDNMASASERNPYMGKLFDALDEKLTEDDVDSLKKQIDEIAPDLLTYAMVLENMTQAMSTDPKILNAVHEEFTSHKEERSAMGVMHKVKYYSVETVIEKALKAFNEGKVPGDFGSILLPLNVTEAALLDVCYGKFGNSRAAWTLIKYGPGDSVDSATGAAPACFNKDKTAIELNMPFSNDWANLYALWNAGFVASLKAFPYHIVKLFITAVNDYRDNPSLYLYNRVCALYVHAHYIAMRQFTDPNFLQFDFSNPKIAKIFSDVNRQNAYDYEAKFDVQKKNEAMKKRA